MFTGIVAELGEVVRLDRTVLTVRGPQSAASARPGDSIAVNGVCLTVVEATAGSAGPAGAPGDAGAEFTADVMQETFDRSTLGTLAPGDPVNLEQAATVGGVLGGHIVQGHVDGVGTITSRTKGGSWESVRVALPPGLARYVVEKGSIAVDGVSLTVVAVADDWFEVGLIPTTLAQTTLGHHQVGALVNLEVDVLAKHVEKLLAGVST